MLNCGHLRDCEEGFDLQQISRQAAVLQAHQTLLIQLLCEGEHTRSVRRTTEARKRTDNRHVTVAKVLRVARNHHLCSLLLVTTITKQPIDKYLEITIQIYTML